MPADRAELLLFEDTSLPTYDMDTLIGCVLVGDRTDPEFEKYGEDVIMNIYVKIIGKKGRIPYLYEVYDEAYRFNDSVFRQMAALTIQEEYDVNAMSFEEYDSMIDDKVEEFEEYYAYNEPINLDYYVASVLNRLSMNYMCDADDFLYMDVNASVMIARMNDMNKNTKLFMNDAQMVMFPDLLDYGFTAVGSNLMHVRPDEHGLSVVRR